MEITDMLKEIALQSSIGAFNLVVYTHRSNYDVKSLGVTTEYNDRRIIPVSELEAGIKEMEKDVDGWNDLNTTGLDDEKYCGIISPVMLASGKEAQMMLIDFSCDKSAEKEAEVTAFLKKNKFAPGYILDSGNSYHFYGRRVLESGSWRDFMAKCGRSRLVDSDWIRLHIDEDYSLLRISSGLSKPNRPRVIRLVD